MNNRKSKELKPLLKGQKFGRLTVLGLEYQKEVKRKDGQKEYEYFYKFKCDCGCVVIKNKKQILHGTLSCGCLAKEVASKKFKTHGKTKTKLFNIWQSIKVRCYLKTSKPYKNYGGRGITMCDEWKNNFMSFYDWAITHGYNENAEYRKCTIDRINVNGNYEPSNCRWVNQKIQQRNTRSNINITYKGKTQCISAWAEELGIEERLFRDRIVRQKMKLRKL